MTKVYYIAWVVSFRNLREEKVFRHAFSFPSPSRSPCPSRVLYDKIWTEKVLLGTKLQISWVGQSVAAMYNCY